MTDHEGRLAGRVAVVIGGAGGFGTATVADGNGTEPDKGE